MVRRFLLFATLLTLVLAACSRPGAGPTPPPLDPNKSTVTASHDAAALGETFVVTVQLRDANDAPLEQADELITFVSSSGDLSAASLTTASMDMETVPTDRNGRASVTLTPVEAGTITVQAFLGGDNTGDLLGSVSVTVAHTAVELDDLTVTYDGEPKTLVPRFYPPEANVGSTLVYRLDGEELDEAPVDTGVYEVVATAGNGYVGSATATLTIESRILTVQDVKWADKPYDGSASGEATAATLVTTNVVNGDEVELADTLPAVFATGEVGQQGIVGEFFLTGDQAHNYVIEPQPTGKAEITPASVSLVDVVVEPKQYDGSTEATVTATISGGLVTGEEVGLAASFATANVGADLAVTVSLVGADAGNYSLVETELTGSITARPLTLRPEPILLGFGEELPASAAFTAEGLVAGESIASASVEVVGSTAPFAAGSHTLRVVDPVAGEGTDLSNYVVSTPEVADALTVVEALVTIMPSGPFSKIYGESDPEFKFTVTGVDAEVLDGFGLTREPGSDVGSYEFALGDVSAWSDYHIVLAASDAFVITPATLTVTPDAEQGKVYGAADPEFTFSTTGLVEGDDLNGELAREEGEALGIYRFNLGSLDAGSNYQLELAPAGQFTIEPAPLELLNPAIDVREYDGSTSVPLDFNPAGIVDDESVWVAAVYASGNVGTDIPVTLTLMGEDAGNYVLVPIELTGSIVPRPLTITPEAITVGLNEPLPSNPAFKVDGLVDGEGIVSIGLEVIDATAPYAAGQYDIKATSPVAADGTNLSNYEISTPTVVDGLSVSMGLITVTPTGPFTKVYGTADPEFEFTVAGINASELEGFSLTREPGEDAGTYEFTLGDVSDWSSYDFVVAETEPFVITPAELTVTPEAGQSKPRGGTDPVFDFTVSGLTNGDELEDTVTGALGRETGEEVGTYAYTLGTLTAGDNYTVSLAGDATFEITAVGVSLLDDTVTYDGQPHELTPEFTPVEAGAEATIEYADAAGNVLPGAPVNAGTYKVTATAGPGFAGEASATLVIEPVALTVSNVSFADKEYDAATGATLSATLDTGNVIAGDNVRLVDRLVGTFASAPVGTHGVTGNVELTGADAGNYVIDPQPTGTASILPRSVSLQGATAEDKNYDGTQDVVIVGGTLNGVRAADYGDVAFQASFTQSDVGEDITVEVELTGDAAGNYNLQNPNLTASINPQPLTITITAEESKPYGTEGTLGTTDNFDTDGLADGEAVESIQLSSTGTAQDAAVGTYDLNGSDPTGEGFNPTNYDITFEPGEYTVEAVQLTVAAAENTWVYGDEPETGDLTARLVGDPEIYGTVTGELAIDASSAGTRNFTQGTLDILDDDNESILDNYELTFAEYEITPRPATITVEDLDDKTYGDELILGVTSDGFTVSGLASGEEIEQVALSSDASDVRASVGTHAVTASEPTGSDFLAANYDITVETGSITVTTREISISGTFSVLERPYDGSDAAQIDDDNSDLQLLNVVEGDDVSLVPALQFDDGAAVGEGKSVSFTADSSLTGADAGNYSLSIADAPASTGTVVKAEVEFEVTIAGTGGMATVTYNGSRTFQPSVTSSVTPVPAGEPVAFIVDILHDSTGLNQGSFRDVGTYTVTVTADDPRYEGTSIEVVEVLAREITIASATSTKTYGEPNPDLTPSLVDSTFGLGDSFSTGELAFDGSHDQFLDVGSYEFNLGEVTITRGGIDVTRNYDITFANEFEVAARVLTISPDADQSKVYGEEDPTFAFTATGFADGEDDDLFTGALERVQGEAADTYEYLLGSLSAGDNYTLEMTDPSETFQITRRPLELTGTTTESVYGNDDFDLTPVITDGSLRDGDAITGELGTPDTTMGDWEFSAGDLSIIRDDQDVTENYDINFGSYAITPRPAVVTPNAEQGKVYGDEDPELSFAIDNWIEGDEVTGALGRTEGETVGDYAFTLGTLSNPNYELSVAEEAPVFTVTQRPVTLGAMVATKEYSDPDPDLSPVLLDDTTLRDGDSFSGQLAHAGVNANASYDLTQGTAVIMRDDEDVTDNYDISFGQFTITRKPVTFDITNGDVTIGSTHVFLGDGESEIRGLQVSSDPAGANSFRFSYRRTHDENHNPVPLGQQTVQNINLLGSYVVTVTATDSNYSGATPLAVWVTDGIDLATGNEGEDGESLNGNASIGEWTTITVPFTNADGTPRALGPVDLNFDLSATPAEGITFHDMDGNEIETLIVPAGSTELNFQVLVNTLTSTPFNVALEPVEDFGGAVSGLEFELVGTAEIAMTGTPVEVGEDATSTPITIQLLDADGNPVVAPEAVTLDLVADEGVEFVDVDSGDVITTITVPAGGSAAAFSLRSAVAGDYSFSVQNASTVPGLDASGTETLTVNPKPFITNLQPASLEIGSTVVFTLLGGEFTEGIAIELGDLVISDIVVLSVNEIRFSASAPFGGVSDGEVSVKVTNPDGGTAEPEDLEFSITKPILTAVADTAEIVEGGTVELDIRDLLANDSSTSTMIDWGFDEIVSTVNVDVTVNENTLTVKSTGTRADGASFQYRIKDVLGTEAVATVTFDITLPPAESIVFLDSGDLSTFRNSGYEPPTFAEVFNTWPRASNGTYFADPSTATGAAGSWGYNAAEGIIVQPLNTSSHEFILSPITDALEYYTFEATLTSDDNDDDSIGLVIAFVNDNGVLKSLVAHRTAGGNSPTGGWGITYFENGVPTNLVNSNQVGAGSLWGNRQSRVRVNRNGDIIRAYATPWGQTSNFMAEMLIDLDANTINGASVSKDLSVFKGARQFGYYTFSQANSTYLNVVMEGGVARDIAILLTYEDSEGTWWSSEVWRFDEATSVWNKTTESIQDVLGYPRIVTSVAPSDPSDPNSEEIGTRMQVLEDRVITIAD